MPTPKNKVDLGIAAHVTGQAELDALIAKFRELLGLIQSASTGRGTLDFLGPSPVGGSPTLHAQQLLQGMPAFGGQGRIEWMTGAANLAETRAISMGLIPALQTPVARAAAISSGPPAMGMPMLPGPGIPGYYGGATPAGGAVSSGGYMPPWVGTPVAQTPMLIAGNPPLALPGPSAPYGGTPMGGSVYGVPPYGAPPMMALPPPGGTSPPRFWYGMSEPAAPGTPMLPGPGGSSWRGAPAMSIAASGMGGGGGMMGGMMPLDAATEQAMEDAAKRSGGRFGNRMMYGLMFQAFFGVLFGGLQEYLQAGATGKTLPGGAATLAPAILNMLGMGIGFAAGGPMGAMAGGFIGQFAGMGVSSVAQAKQTAGRALRTFESHFGEQSELDMHPGPIKSWLYNIGGVTAKLNLGSELASWYLGDPGEGGGYLGLQEQLEENFGGSLEEQQEAAASMRRYARNPRLKQYFRRNRQTGRVGYQDAGLMAMYMTGGEDAAMQYLQFTGQGGKGRFASVVGDVMASRDALQLTMERSGPWIGVYQQGLQMAQNIGPQTFAAAQSNLMGQLNQNLGSMVSTLQTLQSSKGAAGAENEINKLEAGIADLRNQMMMIALMSKPLDPARTFELDVVQQAHYAQQNLPWDVTTGRRGMFGYSADETRKLINPMGQAGFGLIAGSDSVVGRMPSGRRALRLQGQLAMQRISEIRENFLEQVRQVGAEPGSEQYRALAVDAEQKAWPYRQMTIDISKELSSGWMDRMVSAQWGTPSHSATVMGSFNYMGAGIEFERTFGETNRRMGGTRGIRGIYAPASEMMSPRASDMTTGRGGFAGGVQVTMNVSINSSKDGSQVERSLSQFKRDVESASAKIA